MSPLPNIISNYHRDLSFPPIHKRLTSSSDCTNYDTSCSTHRLAIMIVIICVGLIVSGILSFLFVRSRASKAAKERARLQQRQQRKLNDSFLGMQGPYPTSNSNAHQNEYNAPPPYTPRRPERAYGATYDWR